jgi:photosystem II stability/assembly factor-like uncharacterized protein
VKAPVDAVRLLRESNPVPDDAFAGAAEDSLGRATFERITTSSPRPAAVTGRSLQARRRVVMAAALRRRVLVAAAAAVLLVIGAGSYGLTVALRAGGARPAQGGDLQYWRLVGDVTSDTWQVSSVLSANKLPDLECPTTTTCYFVDYGPGLSSGEPPGGLEVTHDGGRTWQQSPVPDIAFLGGIGCAGADDCLTASSWPSSQLQFFATSDGGKSWSATSNPDVPSTVQVSAISCPAAGDCIAVGEDESDQSAGGLAVPAHQSTPRWGHPRPPFPGPLHQTSYAMVTTDDGQTWTVTQLPSGFDPRSLDCPGVDNCVAGGDMQPMTPSSGGAIAYSSDTGSTWALATLTAHSGSQPAAYGSFSSVSCADVNDCAATTIGGKDSTSQVLVSSDGGAAWSEVPASGLPGQFTARQISCPSSTDCWVVGAASTPRSRRVKNPRSLVQPGVLAMTADGGQTFQVSQLPPGAQYDPVTAVSCPSVTVCYAAALSNTNRQPKGSQAQTPFVLLSYSVSSSS